MSMRSFIELNHDFAPGYGTEDAHAMGEAFAAYMRGGDPKELPRCARLVDMRHHSDKVVAARSGYKPAQDECDIAEIAKIISGKEVPQNSAYRKAREVFDFLTQSTEPRG